MSCISIEVTPIIKPIALKAKLIEGLKQVDFTLLSGGQMNIDATLIQGLQIVQFTQICSVGEIAGDFNNDFNEDFLI